ncbi:MAG: hypothetical protein KDC95_23025, partial [Planctomycetes bacterium]|nr:hypothetical protein [Planctomycetota bacterium]
GRALWTSDGTNAGTRMVVDVSVDPTMGRVIPGAAAGNKFVFLADDEVHGEQIWATDGTAAGTTRLTSGMAGNSQLQPGFVEFGTSVLFGWQDATHGRELWRTDGTVAGTGMFVDVQPGTPSGYPNYPDIATFRGKVYFAADDGLHGLELWSSDGTTAGTQLFLDINPGSARGWGSTDMTTSATTLFFTASEPTHGEELWMSDGTVQGTRLTFDLRPGASGSSPQALQADGVRVFYSAEASSATGREPYVFDGVAAASLGDLYPGSIASYPNRFTPLNNGLVVFEARTASSGTEPHVTDGTLAGTKLLRDILPGTRPSMQNQLAFVTTGTAVFSADDGIRGAEAWITDGTTAGTNLLADIGPVHTTASSAPTWNPDQPTDGFEFFFHARGVSKGPELRRYDGATATSIAPIPSSGGSGDFFSFFDGAKKRTLFAAGSSKNPWVTDGTAAGTLQLSTATIGGYNRPEWCPVCTRVVFAALTGTTSQKPWVTDGTVAGTQLLADVFVSRNYTFSPAKFHEYRGLVYFGVQPQSGYGELWVSDGTSLGTHRLLSGVEAREFAEMNGKLYFAGGDATTGRELWVTDGTVAGTHVVADVYPGSGSSSPEMLTGCNGKLYFTANDAAAGREPFVSDGTSIGTRLLVDLEPGSRSSRTRSIIASGTRVFFDTDSGLWLSDGTAVGTNQVPLPPGISLRSGDAPLPAGHGGVYLTVDRIGSLGSVCYTDGTAAGFEVVCDVPYPSQLTLFQGTLSLQTVTVAHGSELMVLKHTPRGHVTSFGSGCAPSLGRITATDPVLGSNVLLTGTAPPSVPSVVFLGAPMSPVALPASAPCSLDLDLRVPLVPLGITATGSFRITLPIPNDASLLGVRAGTQAFYFYGTPVFAASSNVLTLVVGR